MTRTGVLRTALWISAPFNAFGALLFFFPESVGRLAQMPLPAPILYSWFSGVVIGIYAVVYAWLASQSSPDRAFVLVGAIGKLAFFGVCVTSWLVGESQLRLVAIASLDVVLATAFLYGISAKRPVLTETTRTEDAKPERVS